MHLKNAEIPYIFFFCGKSCSETGRKHVLLNGTRFIGIKHVVYIPQIFPSLGWMKGHENFFCLGLDMLMQPETLLSRVNHSKEIHF